MFKDKSSLKKMILDTGGSLKIKPPKKKRTRTLAQIIATLGFTAMFIQSPVKAQSITPLLNGIGYFDSMSDQYQGIGAASLAGGAEVLFNGQGMSHSPADETVIFSATNFQNAGPPLSQDNQFQSYTDAGKLQYTTPSFMQLHGVPYEALGPFDSMSYDVSLLDHDMDTMATQILKCPDYNAANCKIVMSRAYTPVLYYLSPPVVYFGSETAFWVDPRSSQNLKAASELAFTEARIDGYTIEFGDFIDETVTLSGYTRNQVRGKVGNIAPNKNAPVNMKFKVGDSLHYDSSMLRCSYDNQTCYKAKAVPVINFIDNFEGYTTGGQTLLVYGFGFASGKIDVKIDGQPCKVKDYAQEYFTCVTSRNDNPSTGLNYVGQHGLRRKVFNTTFSLSFTSLMTTPNFTEILAMDLEAQKNYKDGYYGNVFTGYFKAPATAKYRFYMSCDDACQINFSNVPMDPTQKATILQLGSYTNYRSYITLDGSRNTDWISLTKDEYYYMEVRHVQNGGGDHLTVSVEIEDPNITPGHQHTSKEMQQIQINQQLIREQSVITITNPDGNKFIINIQNPLNNQLWASPQISTNATAGILENSIRGFYSLVWGAPISVEKVMYDSTGAITIDIKKSVKSVFTITVYRSLPQASTNYVNFQKITTKSQLTFKLPRDTQLSSLPIKGYFVINCALPDGTMVSTGDIGVKNATWQIRDKISAACPNFKEKFDIWDGPKYGYFEDGREFFFRFIGLNYDIPQFTIEHSPDNPLIGNQVSFAVMTPIPYNSQRIFYEPIPFEFLYTDETKPQVIVTVDGLEAVCGSLQCFYNYIPPIPEITDFSYTGTTLTIIGTAFPDQSELRSIKIANQDCEIISATATEITCTVVLTAGEWQPEVIDSKGIIPVSAGHQVTVPLIVTSVSPNTELNPFGGTVLEITGNNFPSSMEDGCLKKVTLSSSSECTIIACERTKISCVTGPFDINSMTTPDSTLTLQVNTKSDSSLTVSVAGFNPKITAIYPSKASPVLKSILTLSVTGFFETLTKSDLSVQLVGVDDPTNIRKLNIVGLSNENGNKFIKVKYGGAYSGNYTIVVNSILKGNFETTGLLFEAVGKVTAFEPSSGSIHGGTLITITGYNFSETEILDNPVRVGYTDCLVQTTSNNQITCRTLPRIENEEGSDDLIVFLKASEEAVFEVSPRKFTWIKTGLPAMTSFTTIFDDALKKWILKIQGTGFGDQLQGVECYIDNVKQEILSVADTEIQVGIVYMNDFNSTNVKLYLPVGIPDGSDLFISQGISITPKFLSIQPHVGSPAGSIISAIVKGAGPKSSGINLVNTAGVAVCETVTVKTYGEVQCKTKVGSMALTSLRFSQGVSTFFNCEGASGDCDYQTDSASMPSVSSLTKVDANTLTLTGTNLKLADFTPHVKLNSIEATTITSSTDGTTLTVTYSKGLPITVAAGVKPEVYLKSDSDVSTHWAAVTSNNINGNQIMYSNTFTNIVTASAISGSPIQCSFAGGCLLTVEQPGLLSNIMNDEIKNNITICGNKCKISETDSTSSTVKCSLPALATTYSVVNYKIAEESYITGKPFASIDSYAQQMFDGINQNGWTSKASNCYFGTAFKANYIGVLNEVKYFMNRFVQSNMVGKLLFQGSNDGTTYTTIFTVGSEIHEGWNYYSYPKGQELKYRYYRFFGNGTSACYGVGEVAFRGVEVIDSNANSYSACPIQLFLDGQDPMTLSGEVTYTSTLTPLLKSISPRFGTVKGGDEVTFTGENFSSDKTQYSIAIDDRVCTVIDATQTYVKCVTDDRPGLYEKPDLGLKIQGMGNAATQGLLFRYTSYWSDDTTWGGEFAPIEGDMVYVPKGLHLLVDVDSTPILSAVLVEGSIIFTPNADPNHLRTFDANYIMIRGGYMEVGTEEFPYTSNLIITMYSNKQSPEIPIYGNKVIAVRHGILDMHGVPRNPTWTMLDSTAMPGSSTITIMRDVDWKIGESIVIAPTSYESTEAEQRTIVAIDRTNPQKPILTLDKALTYKHFAAVQNFGTGANADSIEMRAEVGLLTRNVVFRGDPETSKNNLFGAHIMLHSKGDESVIGRIEYVELRDVGQAFQLGRYPIHFHMIGTVHNSYIRGNAIHHTYNRAVTIHGVHYLRVTENVAYHTMGHTFFIEDAVETKNYLENNLAIQTQPSWSLLNTDQTPASFWITHPDNIFRGNHAAGSPNYGFWFDTKPHPMGPSFDINVCPENAQLGEFTNNVAHSNGKYGLRIFHNLVPRLNPCSPLVFDPNTTVADPYWQNPLITARFINFTSFKNKRNGAIAEKVGDVRWENFKVADNLIAGLEFSLTTETMDGTAMINGSLVIGISDNAEEATKSLFSHGIITPRSENFQVHNSKFFNFDQAEKAALGSCSHCFHAAATDSGARTVTFSKLYFDDATVPRRIRYQYPYRDIFYDLDGTLTGLGAKTWATPYFKHNEQPECQVDLPVYDGILCNSQVQVRRVAFHNYYPGHFQYMDIKFLKIDGTEWNKADPNETEWYYGNATSYSIVPFKSKQDPSNAWAVPMVTGHKYKTHWGYGLDFTTMWITKSVRWQTTDKHLYFVFNFTDVREKVEVITGGDVIENMTLTNKTLKNLPLDTGDNVIYNQTEVREIHLYVDGKNSSRSRIVMNGYRCVSSCLAAIVDQPLETTVRFWSDPNSWPKGIVPREGEDVEVKSGWNMIFDIAESPLYNMVQINGLLTFKPDAPKLHLRAKYVFVRAGSLVIGDEAAPFQGTAQITLYGEKQNQHIVYTNAIEAGNKILANTGSIRMFGKRRTQMARLIKQVTKGDKQITLQSGLDWQEGDRIGLLPTGMHYEESDYAVISSYDATSGVAVLDRSLDYPHFGAAQSTAQAYNGIDMRGEVVLLSRNVRIVGNDSEAWGGQIVTSDFIEENGVWRTGSTWMDSVEIYNCSQYDTYKPAIRFEAAFQAWSQISRSAIHHGLGFATIVTASNNVHFVNNTFFDFKKFGVWIQSSTNVTLNGNILANVRPRNLVILDNMVDFEGGILACATEGSDRCPLLSIRNNIVAGVITAGYSAPAHDCGDYRSQVFYNNTAHSIDGTGAIIFRDPNSDNQLDCLEGSHFVAYKCTEEGAVTYAGDTKKAIFSNMTLIDNVASASVNVGQEGDTLWAIMQNSVFYGEAPEIRDCPSQGYCSGGQNSEDPACAKRQGLIVSYFSRGGKDHMVSMKSALPYRKVPTDASFGGNILYSGLKFVNFKSTTTWCGGEQRVLGLNSDASDYQPRAKFMNTVFENIDQDALAYMFSPPWKWANIDDCGNFPCTAPNNTYWQFEKTQFKGPLLPMFTQPNFQIVSGNQETMDKIPSCKFVRQWNSYYCQNENLGILLFESLDEDKWKRMISPITVQSLNITSKTVLNTFMDHIWDGFYTGQLRLSRWPALIQTGNGLHYQIEYTGTPPSSQRFRLIADASGIIVKIRYTKPGAYIIKDASKKLIKANEWDNALKQPGLIKGDKAGSICGENRYLGVVNILEFYLKAGCDLYIEPIDSIQAAIRLNWTLEGFYANGGTTQFVDRLAASLGIHASNIKIVSVYTGSVVVQLLIVDNEQHPLNGTTQGTLDGVQQSLTKLIQQKTIDLGAPIIGADLKGLPVTIVSDPLDTSKPIENVPKTIPGETQPVIQKNNTEQPPPAIIEVKTVKEIKEAEDAGSGAAPGMIAAVVVVVAFVVISGIVGYIYYKIKFGRGVINSKDSQGNEVSVMQVPNKSVSCSVAASPDKIIGFSDDNSTYEEQYHPKAELGNIYGGVVDKINGDDVNVWGIKEEDEEDGDSESGERSKQQRRRQNGFTTDGEGPYASDHNNSHNLVTQTDQTLMQDNTPLQNLKGGGSPSTKQLSRREPGEMVGGNGRRPSRLAPLTSSHTSSLQQLADQIAQDNALTSNRRSARKLNNNQLEAIKDDEEANGRIQDI